MTVVGAGWVTHHMQASQSSDLFYSSSDIKALSRQAVKQVLSPPPPLRTLWVAPQLHQGARHGVVVNFAAALVVVGGGGVSFEREHPTPHRIIATVFVFRAHSVVQVFS